MASLVVWILFLQHVDIVLSGTACSRIDTCMETQSLINGPMGVTDDQLSASTVHLTWAQHVPAQSRIDIDAELLRTNRVRPTFSDIFTIGGKQGPGPWIGLIGCP
ncbi:hypothetical protein CAPTEDRAFT_207557 [Capitella teleta]|uniref:Secreted protein n=1 Tax=Capitella teleta TaxID=283909 RepID=R7V8K4_CAPTE|nr:hypothetical protein CAPTEDRAFT_207557 [Capitella teleta]|eukprot:ELU14847.1 hypothetical protein CAPTEDRAFT_207557 [Capitella teleta]